ncbi:MAG: methionyl-tRNA formyltransferase [Bacilli bacterium]|nr:methionyl-tRNA formyltransferase [Bacilli bacterium]
MNVEDIHVEKELRIVFMGTPDFAVPVLEGLIENYNVKGIVTQPDRKVGRKGTLSPTPIKEVALKHRILVIQPEKIKEAEEEIYAWKPDLIVTCAYGQILPVTLLQLPRLGCINVHASLLPKLRGGAPIHGAIIKGHRKTGMTIMYMSKAMDAGDIISQREVEITEEDTASTLHDKLSIVGRDLLLETLPSIIEGTNPRTKQDTSEVTYAFNIKREDERIDFSKTKREIYNQVRGLNSWPGAYCVLDGKIVKVWEVLISTNYFPEKFDGQITGFYKEGLGVKVSNGEIILKEIQPEGKGKMKAVDFINGYHQKEELLGKVID